MRPGSSSKLDRNAMEKTRRMRMKGLVSCLSSLIHSQPSKERLPLPLLLDHATAYIKQLKENIEVQKRRKEEINTVNLMLPAVAVKEIGSTLEVNLVTGLDKRNMLHEVLHVLEAEGTAEVLSASYCNVGDKIFYTIYSQAIWPRIGIQTSKVRERLKELVSEFNQDLMEDVMDTR